MSILDETRTVQWGDCAPSGAVFYPVYFRWFDEATWRLFDRLDLSIHGLGARYGVVGLPLLKNDCEFRRTCRLGDKLTSRSSVLEFDDSLIKLRHSIHNQGQLAVESHEWRFWGIRHPTDTARLKKGSIPADVVSVLSQAIKAAGAGDQVP